jgi:hypothetical protein
LIVATGAAAADAQRCRIVERSSIDWDLDSFEWLDADHPRGARIKANSGDPVFSDVHRASYMHCDECRDGRGRYGRVFTELRDPKLWSLAERFTPGALAMYLLSPVRMEDPLPDALTVMLKGPPQVLTVFGIEGLGVLFTAKAYDRSNREQIWSSPVLAAVGFQDGCFSLVTILGSAPEDVSLTDATEFTSAFRVERYQPTPRPPPPVKPPQPSSGGVWDMLQDRMTKSP